MTFRRLIHLPQAGIIMAITKEAKVADKEAVGGMRPDKLW